MDRKMRFVSHENSACKFVKEISVAIAKCCEKTKRDPGTIRARSFSPKCGWSEWEVVKNVQLHGEKKNEHTSRITRIKCIDNWRSLCRKCQSAIIDREKRRKKHFFSPIVSLRGNFVSNNKKNRIKMEIVWNPKWTFVHRESRLFR